MDFDVTGYELEDTGTLTLKNARGDKDLIGADGKSPAQVVLYSPGSPEGSKAQARFDRRSALRMFREMRDAALPTDADDAEKDAREKLVAFTKAFINYPVDAATFYGNTRLIHLRKQVEGYLGKFENFDKGSSQS